MSDVRSQPALGEYLVREGVITQAQLNQALEEQNNNMRSMGRILVDMGFISESARMIILQKRFGFELIRLKDIKIEPAILRLIPYAFAEKHRVVPVRKEEDQTLTVAMEDPSDILIVDAIKNQIGLRVKPVVASQEDIQAVLGQSAQTQVKGAATRAKAPESTLHKVLKHGTFPVLAFALPLVLIFSALAFDFMGWGSQLQDMFNQKIISWFDLALYFILSWVLWTAILFWINGLIFGRPEDEEEE